MSHRMTVGKMIEILSLYEEETPVVVRHIDGMFMYAYLSEADAIKKEIGRMTVIEETEFGGGDSFVVVVVNLSLGFISR